MGEFVIYLIEDRKKHAEQTLGKLRAARAEYAGNEYDFQFELLEGDIPQIYDGEPYVFYDQNILTKIETKVEKENEEENRVGLLLDVMLTQEDIEKSKNSYYVQASISRDIFFKFKERIPIYLISESATFAPYSDIIMGVNLSEQFINQARLAQDPIDSLKGDFKRLFTFYQNFEPESTIDKGTEKDGLQMDIVGA